MTVTLPSRDPDYELVIPSSGTGIDEITYDGVIGGITIPADVGTVDTGTDGTGDYITPASGTTTARFTLSGIYDEFPGVTQFAVELRCEFVRLGGPSDGNASVVFWAGGSRIRMFDRPGVPLVTAIPWSNDVQTLNTSWASGGGTTGYRRIAWVDTFPTLDITTDEPYAGAGTGVDIPVSNPTGVTELGAGSPWFLQFDQGLYHEIRCYGARIWIGPDDTPMSAGLWGLRQRQTLSGNAGGWPLRQRQNGGHTGSWTLRQRQTGV